MTLTTASVEAETNDLLRSFRTSIQELRLFAEDLKQQIRDGEEVDLTVGSKALAPAESLIRNCQRWEASLAEHHLRETGIVQGGYALDLHAARSEIGSRLARLRADRAAREVSG